MCLIQSVIFDEKLRNQKTNIWIFYIIEIKRIQIA